MKIAVLTSGILPVPAVQGGAVENLIDFYLEYNDSHQLHDITVFSVWHPDVKCHPAQNSKVNHYIYIKVTGLWSRLKKKLYQMTHGSECYHYSIEYYLNETLRYIRREHYDMIIMENRPDYSIKLKNVTRAAFVYHLHNEKLSSETVMNTEIYNAASRILTVSDYIKSKVLSINSHDTKTKTVYNGIDISAFSAKHTADRKILGLRNDDFVLLFSGRINRDKGIMELVEAINLLNNEPHIKLLVLGSSFYGNANNKNPFMDELKEKAVTLRNRIMFTGFIPYSEMPSFLGMADVAVVPSIWDDPFPTTILEAQAMGLPIITTRRGGIPEEVTEENAILLNTDKHFVNNLAKAIYNLYKHPESRQRMSAASLERSKLFDKELYASNFFNALVE